MKKIHISASKEYDVLISNGLLERTGEYISSVSDALNAVIISDDIVFSLYGDTVKNSLEKSGFNVFNYVFPNGEKSKNLDTYGKILEFLSKKYINRKDVLIALGGGVVGDIVGFAAATYQRGVDFIQIPTTLLAMVDSSVGGKTAVDLKTGKNQVGCFYQPSLVLCDTDTLNTLPDEQYRAGCAEVIKYAVLGDAVFFEKLREKPVKEQSEYVICTCVSMKSKIVNEDEFDTGLRQILNLGHSIGHAIETLSNYSVLHGYAVAAGMAIISKAAASMGICTVQTAQDILEIVSKYGLPVNCDYSLSDIYDAALTDKKVAGDSINLVLPSKIGECIIKKVLVSELKDWIYAGGIR